MARISRNQYPGVFPIKQKNNMKLAESGNEETATIVGETSPHIFRVDVTRTWRPAPSIKRLRVALIKAAVRRYRDGCQGSLGRLLILVLPLCKTA